ncbi:MAG: tyrosine-type recombinase/integrase [Candidatus Cloacimonetes bacterium]|nr:tyrosine-type recombinase/integrase [Candidatus Cloacimonadota bacterium]
MNIKPIINEYLYKCSNVKKLEPLTIKAYRIDLNQFCAYVSTKTISVSSIDKQLIQDYIETISKKYAVKSLKRKIASVKAFFNYLEFEDYITVTPFRKIRICIKEPQRLPKSLSLFDMEKLLSFLYSQPQKKKIFIRNLAVFELMFATGIRVSELCNIKMSDIDLDTQTLSILGKGNKERLCILNNAYVISALRNYLEIRPAVESPYLFINRIGKQISPQSVRFFIEDIGKKVLNKLVTPHMFRHTFATLLLEEGVDINHIKSFLGHASITTTQIYTASTTHIQRKILTSMHPRNRIRILRE